MIASEILLGVVCVACGGGMLYYAQAKHDPPFIKPKAVNRVICAVLGLGTLISGLVYTLAGLVGWDISPFR